jgi:hypothetical protein
MLNQSWRYLRAQTTKKDRGKEMIELGVYKHFKGNLYRVILTATDANTEEIIVIYVPLYGNGRVSARTEADFTEEVDRLNYKGARFVKVKE